MGVMINLFIFGIRYSSRGYSFVTVTNVLFIRL